MVQQQKKLTQQRRDPRWDEVSGNVPTGKAVGAGLWKLWWDSEVDEEKK